MPGPLNLSIGPRKARNSRTREWLLLEPAHAFASKVMGDRTIAELMLSEGMRFNSITTSARTLIKEYNVGAIAETSAKVDREYVIERHDAGTQSISLSDFWLQRELIQDCSVDIRWHKSIIVLYTPDERRCVSVIDGRPCVLAGTRLVAYGVCIDRSYAAFVKQAKATGGIQKALSAHRASQVRFSAREWREILGPLRQRALQGQLSADKRVRGSKAELEDEIEKLAPRASESTIRRRATELMTLNARAKPRA